MSRYTIERACLSAQKEEILALLKRNLSGITDERYQWTYLNYPCHETITWVAKDSQADGRIVGAVSLFLREISVNNNFYTAAVTGDIAVDKENRAFGPALALQKQSLSLTSKDGVDLVYSVTSVNSELLIKRLGSKKLGRYRRYVKLLRANYKKDKSILPSYIPKIMSIVADGLIKMFSAETWYFRPKDIKTAVVGEFDGRFDLLDALRNRSGLVCGRRSSAFLQWRFFETKYQDYRVFTVSDKENKLIGYVVFYVLENVAYVADMLFSERKKAFKILFSEFSRLMRKECAGSISMRFVGGKSSLFSTMNFMEDKSGKANFYCYANDGTDIYPLVTREDSWYFMEADNDI